MWLWTRVGCLGCVLALARKLGAWEVQQARQRLTGQLRPAGECATGRAKKERSHGAVQLRVYVMERSTCYWHATSPARTPYESPSPRAHATNRTPYPHPLPPCTTPCHAPCPFLLHRPPSRRWTQLPPSPPSTSQPPSRPSRRPPPPPLPLPHPPHPRPVGHQKEPPLHPPPLRHLRHLYGSSRSTAATRTARTGMGMGTGTGRGACSRGPTAAAAAAGGQGRVRVGAGVGARLGRGGAPRQRTGGSSWRGGWRAGAGWGMAAGARETALLGGITETGGRPFEG